MSADPEDRFLVRSFVEQDPKDLEFIVDCLEWGALSLTNVEQRTFTMVQLYEEARRFAAPQELVDADLLLAVERIRKTLIKLGLR